LHTSLTPSSLFKKYDHRPVEILVLANRPVEILVLLGDFGRGQILPWDILMEQWSQFLGERLVKNGLKEWCEVC
jgi:hypothetical protein